MKCLYVPGKKWCIYNLLAFIILSFVRTWCITDCLLKVGNHRGNPLNTNNQRNGNILVVIMTKMSKNHHWIPIFTAIGFVCYSADPKRVSAGHCDKISTFRTILSFDNCAFPVQIWRQADVEMLCDVWRNYFIAISAVQTDTIEIIDGVRNCLIMTTSPGSNFYFSLSLSVIVKTYLIYSLKYGENRF